MKTRQNRQDVPRSGPYTLSACVEKRSVRQTDKGGQEKTRQARRAEKRPIHSVNIRVEKRSFRQTDKGGQEKTRQTRRAEKRPIHSVNIRVERKLVCCTCRKDM